VPDIADCPTSRHSGRHIIPPLAFWKSERMLIDPFTNVSKIVCDSPVVKAEEPTDKLSCSLNAKASNSGIVGQGTSKRLGIRVSQEMSLEFSALTVENENALVSVV